MIVVTMATATAITIRSRTSPTDAANTNVICPRPSRSARARRTGAAETQAAVIPHLVDQYGTGERERVVGVEQ
jgi:hypothetical protein